MAAFIVCIVLFAAALLYIAFSHSIKATQGAYLETRTAEYQNEAEAYYYGDYGIQYHPGQAASAIAVIGVCLDDARPDFKAELSRRLSEDVKGRSMSVMVLDSQGDTDAERHNINELVARRVDAIIWSPVERAQASPERIYNIKKFNIPVINICNPVDVLATDMVDAFLVPDGDEYAKLAVSALAETLFGYTSRNILILPEAGSSSPGMDISALEQAFASAGRLISTEETPDCVFAAAPGALAQALTLRERHGCAIVCGYMDGEACALIRQGAVAGAIASSPASISKNAAAFAADAVKGVKTPVSGNAPLYLVNKNNLHNSADTWYLAYEQ